MLTEPDLSGRSSKDELLSVNNPESPFMNHINVFLQFSMMVTGADLGKKLRGDLYAGIYSKIGSIQLGFYEFFR